MADRFDDREGVIWMNGEYLPWQDAKIHFLNQGLHYASSVFEGERAYSGKIFKLPEHTDRLIKSAEMLGFDIPYKADQINQICQDLIAKQGVVDGYVRPVAWQGSKVMGVSTRENETLLGIACWSWPNYFQLEGATKGVRMITSKWRRPPPNTAPTSAKASGLYTICSMSKNEAEKQGYNDALILDWRGQITEATGANIFFVKGNELHTPIPDCFLNGITRQTVIDLARKSQIKVVERVIWPEELAQFDEAFLTGTAVEVLPIGQIDQIDYPIGKMTMDLRNDYLDLVRL